jgi:hypothetical protein
MISSLSKKNILLFLIIAAISGIMIYFILYAAFQENQKIDFNAQIRPIINNKCITCHGGVKQSGGFSLLFRSEDLCLMNQENLP